MTDPAASYDVAVVGGGLVGSAIAYGLAREGLKTALIDEGDVALRASRGNFGLVWVQSKGLDFPPYAHWTRSSSDLWGDFARELRELTGIEVAHQRPGGIALCLTEEELNAAEMQNQRLRQQLGDRYDYEMLDNKALRARIPEVSEAVAGASYCPHDGHVNPLYLLRALHAGLGKLGGAYLPQGPVDEIQKSDSGFALKARGGDLACDRVVLTAGHGNSRLAPMVGLAAPLRPLRGQLMITERVQPFLSHPTLDLRQTAEGSLQVGVSHEEVGFDDGTTAGIMKAMAERAVATFPFLGSVRVVRTWGAIRIMTPDGVPVYDASESCPGAYLAVCHSGVTLAAVHARRLPGWIAGRESLPELAPFTAGRFDVQAAG